MKTILLVILSVLVLTSCDTKTKVESQKSELETLITNQFSKADKYFKENAKMNDEFADGVEFKEIVSIKKSKNDPKQFFIVVSANELIDGVQTPSFYVDIYEEDGSGKGKIVGVSKSLTTLKDANHQANYFQKNQRWDRFNTYSEYMDELDRIKLSLESMKNEYSGRYDELGISSDRYNQPSDYYEEIDQHLSDLKNLKVDTKNDLKDKNISEKEYEIIIDGVNDLSPQLDEFKYTIR